MIHKIFVPVRGDGKGDNVLAHAAALARRFCAHIDITHCRARPQDFLPFGVPIPAIVREQLLESASTLSDLEEQGLRDEVMVLCKTLNLKLSDKPVGTEVTTSFTEIAGRQVDVIRRHGRLANVIAVAQPDRDRNLGANTLKTALFHSGRAVLMCPHQDKVPEILGKNIAIAWNGSLESTRAVAMTRSLITRAESVTVLSSGDEPNLPTADELVEYLSHWGVAAKIATFAAKRKPAKRMLALSHDIGADLLIMGAYGDSHERETIFGGNTQYVVDHADMPVMMVH